MHQVQVPVKENDEGWRQGCNKRMERLKATQFPSDEDPPSQLTPWQQDLFWEKSCLDSELQKAVENGDANEFVEVLERVCLERKRPLSVILDQVTRGGDSLLHVAASFGRPNIAELIGHHFPELLTKPNIMGDIPLHVAATSKSVDVIEVILSQYNAHTSTSPTQNDEDEEKIITRITNEYGNTALHEAVSQKHVKEVTLLFEADKCMAHSLNKSSISPLYLAVFDGSKEIVDIMLQAPFPDDKPLPKFHGISPLHAAVHRKNATLLKYIMNQRTELIYLRDEEGGTPLHYAATTGFVEGVRVLLKTSVSTALEWNLRGHLPVHLACKWGHVEVLKELLKNRNCPKYSGALLNQKGQNILHIATKNGRDNVVKYLLKIRSININVKDKDGNTPLHLAAKYNFPSILRSLTQDKRILLNVLSNEGTPRDTLWKHSDVPMTIPQWLSEVVLSKAGAVCSFKTRNSNKSKQRVAAKEDGMKENINTLMVVTVLIVTVTFGAAVTLPTYDQDEVDTFMLEIFVDFNSIAMCFSTVGCLLLIWAQFGGDRLAKRFYNSALCMMFVALVSLPLAFLAVVDQVSMAPHGVIYFCAFIFYVLIGNLCTLSFLVFRSRKPIPVPSKIMPMSIKILIWFYKNSPREKKIKKKLADFC